eukprot:COSAG06_NODE_36124_length_451_cov_1.093750_1_plen_27_part_10
MLSTAPMVTSSEIGAFAGGLETHLDWI